MADCGEAGQTFSWNRRDGGEEGAKKGSSAFDFCGVIAGEGRFFLGLLGGKPAFQTGA
jgi:hypothetical protein